MNIPMKATFVIGLVLLNFSEALAQCDGTLGGSSTPCVGTTVNYYIYNGATDCSFSDSDVYPTSGRTVSGTAITWNAVDTYTIYFRCSCGTVPKTIYVQGATANPGTISVSPSSTVCPGQTGVTITASTGGVLRWERMLDNELDWTVINYTGNTLPSEYINTTIGGQYRALKSGTCGATAYSPNATISLISFNGYFMDGGGTFCHYENRILKLSGSESNTTYDLLRPDGSVFGSRTGFGSELQWENVSIADGSGTYRVRATKEGCSTLMTSGAEVTFLAEPVKYNVSGSSSSFCTGGPYPTVNLSGSQDNTYTYKLYRNGANTNQSKSGTGGPLSFTVTEGGDYTIQASRSTCNGTVMHYSANITEISPSVAGGTASPSPSTPLCPDGTSSVPTITLGGYSGTIIHWERILDGESAPTIISSTSSTFPSASIVMNKGGEYRALIEGTCGATAYSAPAILTLQTFTTYFLEGGDEYCYSANVILRIAGSESSTSYQLIRPDGTDHGTPILGGGSPIEWIDVTSQDGSGTFHVKAIKGGCTSIVTTSGAFVTFSQPPVIKDVTASATSFCSNETGPTVNIEGSEDGITYMLYLDAAYANQSKQGNNGLLTFTVSEGGRYTVKALRTGCTAVDMNGYIDVTKLIAPDPPVFGAVSQFCGFAIVEKGTTATNWYWLPDANTFDESNNNQTKRVDANSTVFLGAKGSNGCWSVSSLDVTLDNTRPNVIASASQPNVCKGDRVTLTASGADFYIWHDNAGNVMHENAVFETPMLTATSSFMVSGYDAKGCFKDVTISISVLPEENLVPENPYLTKPVGQYELNKNNIDNTPPGYTYHWQNTPDGEETQTTSEPWLAPGPGVYYLRAKNQNGCWGPSISIEVPDLTPPVYSTAITNEAVNYVRTYTFKQKDLNISDPDLLTHDQADVVTKYLDGLGRPMQQVIKKGSVSQADLVEPIDYDQFGRNNRKFMTYSAMTSTGEVQGQPFTAQRTFYQTAEKVAHSDLPLSYYDFEDSPLNREKAALAPGEAWVGTTGLNLARGIKNEYLVNVNSDNVLRFEVDATGGLLNAGVYGGEALTKTQTLDEHQNEVTEFRNKSGLVILKRVKASTSGWADTYYVYDDFGNLRFVLPPKLVENILLQAQPYTPTQTELDNFAFQYRYDPLKRMSEKKVPGAGWIYMVYDKRDRLVLTQDSSQRTTSPYYWTFTKYDELNRPILTGIKDTAVWLSQEKMQAVVDYHYTKALAKWGEIYSASGPIHGYSNNTYPIYTSADFIDPAHFLTVTYYDNYQFRDQWIDDYTYADEALSETVSGILYQQPATESLEVTGQVTGSKVKVLDGGTRGRYTWLKSVNYYDDRYRLIQSIADNYKGGQDRVTTLYDFAGKVLETKIHHTTNEISWTGLVNTVVAGNNLIKTALGAGWTAGGVTVQQLPAGVDGWIECIITEANQKRAFGLTEVNEGEHRNTIDYAFWHDATAAAIFENGSLKYTLPDLVKSGDVIRIERTGTTIKYYKNGVFLYSSTTPSTTALIGDASIDSGSGNILVPRASFNSTAESVIRRLVYDHAGRVTEVWHQINAAPEVRLTYNEYNELGQLIDKKLHSTGATASDAHQSVDYRYNIRGWLTDMNENNLATGDAGDPYDYFSFQLAYNDDAGIGNAPAYNGNISAMKWSTNLGFSEEKMAAYTYGYDEMNRITGATFKTGSGLPEALSWSTPADNSFSESGYSYDLNGNILGLTRKGKGGSDMDILTYEYGAGSAQSNRLLKVTDAGSKTEGFTEKVSAGDDYVYDNNGNLVWDKNKGGEEVLVNGDFTMGSANWVVTDPGGRLTFVEDSLKITSHATESATLRQNDIILRRAAYVVIVDMVRVAGSISINVGSGGNTSVNTSGKTVLTCRSVSGNDFVVTIPKTFSGRINSIEVKGIVVISYNYLNLPEYVSKGPQQQLGYIYDAGGRKISQELYNEAGLIAKKSDYEGEFFYENDTLRFINHEEGRVVMQNSLPEYQYHLKDHLGNVRLTFTTEPDKEMFTASFEAHVQAEEQTQFENYDPIDFDLFDHTDSASVYTFAQLLNGGNNSQIGLAKSLSVMPGDSIKAEVYAKYRTVSNPPDGNLAAFASALTGAFGLSADMTGDPALAYDALDTYGAVIAGGFDHSEDVDAPKAYLNILLFDRNYNFVDASYKQIGLNDIQTDAETANGIKAEHGYLERAVMVSEAGYAFIFLSNENPTQVDVYFDDFKLTHSKSPVIQMDDYYPFGLAFNSYSREDSAPNQDLYNGKELQDELNLGWIDFGARMYIPEICRWGVIDPLADALHPQTPYSYTHNNPINFTDPTGMFPEGQTLEEWYAEKEAEWDALEAGASVSEVWGLNRIMNGKPKRGKKQNKDKIITVQVDAVSVIEDREDIQNHQGTIGDMVRMGLGEKLSSSVTLIVKISGGKAEVMGFHMEKHIEATNVANIYSSKGVEGEQSPVNVAFSGPITGDGGVMFAQEFTARPAPEGQALLELSNSNTITITQLLSIAVDNSGAVTISTNSSTFPSTTFNISVTTVQNGSTSQRTAQTYFGQQSLKHALSPSTFRSSQTVKKVVFE